MITTNTGAKKIEGTDNWRQIFDAHNDSVDAHDKISDAMTYVVNGNKSIESVSIPVGHYFRLANSSIAGRSDGLYTAKIAIPVDTVIDATYFNEAAPITGGIAEALNSKIATKIYVKGTDYTLHSSINNSNTYHSITQNGNIIVVSLAINPTSAIPQGTALVTFTQPLPAHSFARSALVTPKTSVTYRSIGIEINGSTSYIANQLAIDNGTSYDGQMIIVLRG